MGVRHLLCFMEWSSVFTDIQFLWLFGFGFCLLRPWDWSQGLAFAGTGRHSASELQPLFRFWKFRLPCLWKWLFMLRVSLLVLKDKCPQFRVRRIRGHVQFLVLSYVLVLSHFEVFCLPMRPQCLEQLELGKNVGWDRQDLPEGPHRCFRRTLWTYSSGWRLAMVDTVVRLLLCLSVRRAAHLCSRG